MKKILGLDLGTNSIGWALVEIDENENPQSIKGIGSRIIPMSQDILGKFDSGNSISQTAERTGFRGTRRLRERHLLRRERLHRVLHILGFLPKHYEQYIDFEKRLGKYLTDTEPKIAWKVDDDGKYEFVFKKSFYEMVSEFEVMHPNLFADNKLIPYDWTIYYLRKKALTSKIEKEELTWLLLNFNQKRGYYQLRGEEEEENPNKLVEFHALRIIEVTADEPQKGKSEIWYNLILENGWIYRRSSKTPLFDWKDKTKEFIVTTDLNDDGSIKKDKEGNEKRSFRAPSEDDWTLLKKKTESDIDKYGQTVGCYIYDTLLQKPTQKINGKLIRTIERKFYKSELSTILKKQIEFHSEFNNVALYNACLEELYENNEAHRNNISKQDFIHLFINDIIFYQRPLKSKKSLISNCKYECRSFKDLKSGEIKKEPIKCIAKSHPLYQELRLWKFVQDLRIFEREKNVNGKLVTDVDVTSDFLSNIDEFVALFDWLNSKKEIKQDVLLSSYFNLKKKRGEEKLSHRWNYVEDKEYPCNETRSLISSRLSKANISDGFLNNEIELELWHILYSIEDKTEIEKALKSFARRYKLGDDFVEVFRKFPPFKKEYGAYSEKAIKKLLPLMRMGKYWCYDLIDSETKERIEKIQNGEYDEQIKDRVREKTIHLKEYSSFQGLPEWLACYVVYGRHAESSDVVKWATPNDLEIFLQEFKQHSLRNPIVEQVITETLRVVKDIWKKYGDISEIHIELGREMKNPADKRKSLTAQITENENTNLRIKALLSELVNHNDIENVRPYSPSQQEILKLYEDGVLSSSIEIPDDITKIAKMSQPSQSELVRYKLWLEQKYRSPYTGEVIPLSKLFTAAYEIEHIIPQSRYFDDSLSNKVICEAQVNKEKDNALGYEFIKNNEGRIVELNFGKKVKIFTLAEYEDFIKLNYGKSRTKMKKLLMEDIPDAFIERQLNDSRYISKVIKSLLSNIVREEGEIDAISKNVIPCTGGITSILKQDWGLNDVWNRIVSPRFERLNELTKTSHFGQWTNKDGKRVFQTEMPLALQKGFNKKRIDHRHHAMDALVIACATRNHINYLNNESAKPSSKVSRFDLKSKLCFKAKTDDKENYKWMFHKPWDTFTQNTQSALENIVVSFKQNLRVINKTVNKYQTYENGIKTIKRQEKGESWAIRKPLHKDTVAGVVNLRFKKTVTLSAGIDQWKMLVDKNLKLKIKQLINDGFDKKKIQKFFGSQNNQWMGIDISKVDIYYFSNEKDIQVASRVNLDMSFGSKKIESITDTGIQKILLKHLANYNEMKSGKEIEHPELAFSPEGIEEMNKNITTLNNGKFHQSILKVRTYEPKGNKFNVGVIGNKKDKYVEAAKGTNLFFAIYADEDGNRSFETIPLNIVVERQKQGLREVPEQNEKGDKLLFHLSPNDLIYLPNKENVDYNTNSIDDLKRIYKIVSFTGNRLYALPQNIAKSIVDKVEFTQLNKMETDIVDNLSIKQYCQKLKIDRLGNISF
ncbi:type II CRISPR RNA-guided endonuclease Cas9 [Parabacteroides sp. FAFU027]|uniref:type II CRISPR RNA-guided endonuclease Cas9 n=1 Tax=Parabacteroides sp. FAFU027 TaxID=2922715 RepID=UPI001FAFB9E4|nr:type II CRISPR RNA-guided endonuclease Cas9 [Parabacteroides sp. FAFU027]